MARKYEEIYKWWAFQFWRNHAALKIPEMSRCQRIRCLCFPLSKRITFTTWWGVFMWAGLFLTMNMPEVFLWGSSEAGCQRPWAAVTGSILAKKRERVRRYAQHYNKSCDIKTKTLQNSNNVYFLVVFNKNEFQFDLPDCMCPIYCIYHCFKRIFLIVKNQIN